MAHTADRWYASFHVDRRCANPRTDTAVSNALDGKDCQVLMLSTLLPQDVAVVEAEDWMWGGVLYADEAAGMERAVPRRKREFTAGRVCARVALKRLGEPPQPILRGTDGAPRWPAGMVGSITHCDGYCAAAVAYREKVCGVGIDAEVATPLGEEVSLICTPRELEIAAGSGVPSALLPSMIFSAKESFYKLYYPLAGAFLDFFDVEITVIGNGGFDVELINDAMPDFSGLRRCQGRFAFHQGYVFSAVIV